MPLVVIGASHQTTPLEVRERLAFRHTEHAAVLAGLVDSRAASEALLLSTCNRTELYLAADDERRGIEAARAVLSERAGATDDELQRHLYVHRDRAAVAHLFRVAAGLESMVLGEPQIQGQVKEAYLLARQVDAGRGPVVGTVLNRLLQSAAAVGGKVRSETGIGIGAASISSAAVELAKKIFGSLRGRRAMVLGAGEMSEVTLECLRAEGVESTVVANRSYNRARELAVRWSGTAIRFPAFEAALAGVDIVVCSTAAPHPVLTRERFRRAVPDGLSHPLCVIDIALPRDVEPTVGDEPNVFLYNLDDLRDVVGDNLDRRRAELPRAEPIIAAGVEEFWAWYSSLAVVPTIRDLRLRGEQVRQEETERLLRRLAHLSAEDQQAIDALTRSLLNKLLHAPTVRLREAAGNGRGTAVLDTARYLFELDAARARGDGLPAGALEGRADAGPRPETDDDTPPRALPDPNPDLPQPED